MSLLVNAERISLLVAKETTLGTQPTAGWFTLQPNQGGVSDFYPKNKTVAPSPLSKFRQLERPEIVDLDATPKLTHDWTADFITQFGEGVFLALAKQTGGTGVAYWSNKTATATITARTSTAYTVTAGGALQAGTLVVPRGWATGANATANGTLQVVGAASTGTSITVASGVAETPAGAYAVTLEVAGFRGASGDIQINGSGNLISTVADFTTMGLTVGQWIKIGGDLGTAFAFATSAYNGYAQISAIAANLITLVRRSWTVASADTGTSKTIDLYWNVWIRNVATDDANFTEPSYHMELGLPGVGAAGVTEYVYSAGNVVQGLKINSPGQNIVTTDIMFQGQTIGDPTTSRATGANTAAGLLAIGRLTSVSKQKLLRVTNRATEAIVSSDIDSFSLNWSNGYTPQKQQGTLGTARNVVGKAQLDVDLKAWLTQDEGWKACSANTALAMVAAYRNDDGGVLFDVPSLTWNDAPPDFPGNGAVSLAIKGQGFRDPTGNYTFGMTRFAFLPNG